MNIYYIYRSIYEIYIPKYSLLCLYISFIYIFRVNHLLLDNQLVCSSLEKTASAVLSIPPLPAVLHIRLLGFSHPIQRIYVVLVQLTGKQLWWREFTVLLLTLPRHKNPTSSVIFWLLWSFCPLFCNLLWYSDINILIIFCRNIRLDRAPRLCILIGYRFL